mmetsp:Transcript_43034/g.133918  ORF Transcript_43034/g.133918 Transcript_43034/m.133918 type:complete len:284 (-) Transcript_43034:919-1770(-)
MQNGLQRAAEKGPKPAWITVTVGAERRRPRESGRHLMARNLVIPEGPTQRLLKLVVRRGGLQDGGRGAVGEGQVDTEVVEARRSATHDGGRIAPRDKVVPLRMLVHDRVVEKRPGVTLDPESPLRIVNGDGVQLGPILRLVVDRRLGDQRGGQRHLVEPSLHQRIALQRELVAPVGGIALHHPNAHGAHADGVRRVALQRELVAHVGGGALQHPNAQGAQVVAVSRNGVQRELSVRIGGIALRNPGARVDADSRIALQHDLAARVGDVALQLPEAGAGHELAD